MAIGYSISDKVIVAETIKDLVESVAVATRRGYEIDYGSVRMEGYYFYVDVLNPPPRNGFVMNEDLKWIAKQVDEWKEGATAVQEFWEEVHWQYLPIEMLSGIGEYMYTKEQWEEARRKLGLEVPKK